MSDSLPEASDVRLCRGIYLEQGDPWFLRLSSWKKLDHSLGLPGHVHQTVLSPARFKLTFLFKSF